MRIAAFTTLLTVLIFLFMKYWLLVPVAYAIGGIIWAVHESARPALSRSMAHTTAGGTILVFVIWPIRMIYDFLDSWRLMTSEERYVVVGKGNIERFGNWNVAIEAAIKRAAELNDRVMVIDQAKFAKQLGQVQWKSWWVNQDGTIEKHPRRLG